MRLSAFLQRIRSIFLEQKNCRCAIAISVLLSLVIWSSGSLAQSSNGSASEIKITQAASLNARTLLQQAVAASGGIQPSLALTHVSGTGTITYHWANQDVNGNASLSWSTSSGLTLESDTEYGKRTLTSTASSGSIVDERGRTHSFSTHNAARTQLQYLPAVELALILNQPSAVVQSGGLVSISGQPADAIMVSGFWASHGKDAANQTVIYYLDHTTHLVLRRDDYVEVSPSSPGRLPRQITYSDYRQVGGLFLPFAISEALNQQSLYSITLSQLSAQ